MNRQAGFSLVEMLVALAITLIVVTATLGAFNDALKANQNVTQVADMTDNLRAAMNYMVADLIQAGTGIPTGGIPLPANGDPPVPAAAYNRPSPPGMAYAFTNGPLNDPATFLPAVSPGANMGPSMLGRPTDMITILYADTTLPLFTRPINSASNPTCNGTISGTGDTVTFDINCQNLNTGSASLQPGDLIMFSNAQGNAVQYVSSVSGQVARFNSGDPFNFNGIVATAGTIRQLQSSPGVYPPTTATRILMITYYLDNTTDPQYTRLVRQVNFNTPRPVGEILEDLQITYNLVDGVTNPTNVKAIPAYPANLSENQLRMVNLFLGARSSGKYYRNHEYFRSNLATQVSLRSLAYVNHYPES